MFFGKKSLNRLGNITKQITPEKRVGISLLCPVKNPHSMKLIWNMTVVSYLD